MFYMMLSSPRVMEGLHRAQHFSGLLIDTLRLTTQSEHKVASLILDVSDAAFSASRHAMEYLLMGTVNALRHAVAASFAFAKRVSVTDGRPFSTGRTSLVYFGHSDDRIVFHPARSAAFRYASRSFSSRTPASPALSACRD